MRNLTRADIEEAVYDLLRKKELRKLQKGENIRLKRHLLKSSKVKKHGKRTTNRKK